MRSRMVEIFQRALSGIHFDEPTVFGEISDFGGLLGVHQSPSIPLPSLRIVVFSCTTI